MRVWLNRSHIKPVVSPEFQTLLGQSNIFDYGRSNSHILYLIDRCPPKRFLVSGDIVVIEIPDNTPYWRVRDVGVGEICEYVDPVTLEIKEV